MALQHVKKGIKGLRGTLPGVCKVPDEEVEFPGGRVPPALPPVIQGRGRGHLIAVKNYGTKHKSLSFSHLIHSFTIAIYCLGFFSDFPLSSSFSLK